MTTLGLVGCGLIGGSVALAAKHKKLFDSVLGTDDSEVALSEATELGIIDGLLVDYSAVDAICIAVPMQHVAFYVAKIADSISDHIPIFDVGSVKGSIFRELDQVPANFVGCHPIAGSHLQGPNAAQRDLFEGAVCVITPTESASSEMLETVRDFWQRLGSRVICMSPDRHDKALLLTSHLPHLLAAAAVGQLSEDESITKDVIGTGFRDFSRIAAGDAKVWADIFQKNSDELRQGFRRFSEVVECMIANAESDPEELNRQLKQIAAFRERMDSE